MFSLFYSPHFRISCAQLFARVDSFAMQFLLAGSNLLCLHRNTEIEAKIHRHKKSACMRFAFNRADTTEHLLRRSHCALLYTYMRYVAKIFKLKWENWNAIKKPFYSINAESKWKRHTFTGIAGKASSL